MLLMIEGWDKYGPANSNSAAVAALLTAGEWTSTGGGNLSLVAPLSAVGFAVNFGSASSASKTLAANYSRLIGGFRFSGTLAALGGIGFNDGVTNQCGVTVNTAGNIVLRNGNAFTGTVIATSAASVTANSVHYLEFDLTFSNTGAYQVWLDGVSLFSGTGDLTATANSFANAITFATQTSGIISIDDLYLFDSTGATNNAPLLTSPRIETQFPTGDGAVQFAVGAAMLGTSVGRTSAANISTAANQFRVRPFTPSVNMTLSSISFLPGATNASIQFRPVVYGDSAGVPGTLMSVGSVVTGITNGVVKTMPLTTPQALTAGTQYWLGHMCDVFVASALANLDNTNTDRQVTSTFASGAPGTAPATSTTTSTVLWGNVTPSSPVNWYEVGQNPVQGSQSYVFEATVGEEDLYTYPALSAPPSAIYAVAVKASVSKSDAGAKTVSVRMKSGATDSAGTGGTLAPGTSYGWLTSHYSLDPNGSVPWTQSALNAAQAGLKIDA